MLGAPSSTRERGAEPPKFLERWMASYLAELLAREKRTAGKARNAVRAEMASVVPQLWELQLGRDALAVRMRVDWWERRVKEFDDSTAALLRPILEAPNRCVESEVEEPEALLAWLASAENLFRRYLLALRQAQKSAATVAPGREHEVVVVFGKRDEQAADLAKEVFKLLPKLTSVDPNDIDANREILGQAMVNAITARFALASVLDQRETEAVPAASQPKPRSKSRKEKPPSK